jgi:hypothetical protein
LAIASIISIKNLHNTIAPASQHVKEYHSASGDGQKCRTVPHESAASNCAEGHACRSIFGGRHRQPEHPKKNPLTPARPQETNGIIACCGAHVFGCL